jgi:hypothetical protein
MILAALVYLVPFVPRGWVPHDEGMLGQSADRVLHGAVPHIGYEDAYTGGLSWMYAAVFKIAGVDLLNIRWLLFGGAACATCLVYAIARRYLAPPGAALASWVALGWSFPNYFAGLPSWWLLVAALACLWAEIRRIETGRWRYAVTAGLVAGVAMTIKQTGAYLVVALTMSLLFEVVDAGAAWRSIVERLARTSAAIAAPLCAGILLWSRHADAEGVYLLLPVAACALALLMAGPGGSSPARSPSPFALVMVAAAAASLPVAGLLIPYVLEHHLWDFFNGVLLLPQKRLTFASMSMPSAMWILSGVPLLAWLALGSPAGRSYRSALVKAATWIVALVLPIAALWNADSYQAIWQSVRAAAALIPIVACGWLIVSRCRDPRKRAMLFASVTILAWMSLNQFPFAAPIYFSYVAPLAIVAAIAVADAVGVRAGTMLAPAAMLLLFAVLCTNRETIHMLGVGHAPREFEFPLKLRRAHLVIDEGDAYMYWRVMMSVEPRLRGGRLVAGPDCPEVYFLAGSSSPSGTLYDFLSDRQSQEEWANADVVVINHAPEFSPALSTDQVVKLRSEFEFGEQIGRFEVRWR